MEYYNIGNLIFWLICLGLLTGGVGSLFFGKKARSAAANILGSVVFSIIAGIIAYIADLAGAIAFGVMGAAAFLILFNVFCLVEAAHTGEVQETINRI